MAKQNPILNSCSVKGYLTESDHRAVAAARGDEPESTWVRRAVLAQLAAEGHGIPDAPPDFEERGAAVRYLRAMAKLRQKQNDEDGALLLEAVADMMADGAHRR